MHRINIYIYGFNTRSWRNFELSGAKRELVLKQHVSRDGELYDLYGYGLLRSEFEELRDMFQKKFKGIDLATMIEDLRQAPAAAEVSP
jgi:hypothetical protein